MSDDQIVVSQSNPIEIGPKVSEIDFGYHHVNDTYIVYPGRCQANYLAIQFVLTELFDIEMLFNICLLLLSFFF